jgi:sugar/nucleoside kinase (ribokinase family)
MPRDITVIGPLNIDLLIVGEGPPDWESLPNWDGPATMQMTAAGSVGYHASDLARLGLHVAVSSCVPDDPLGAFIVDALNRDGVDTQEILMVPDTEGGIGVYMLLFGSRKRPLVYRLPSHEPWPQAYTPEAIDHLLDARILHTGGYLHFKRAWSGVTTEVFQEAKRRGLTTAMDPQFPLFAMDPPWMTPLEDILPYIDILLCDETEARNLTALDDLDACAQTLREAGPEIVVIKQGDQGATVYREGWRHHQPPFAPGELVDSIGAGDAFDAGFLLGTLEGWSLERRARFASVAAGFTITGVGGTETFPTRSRVEKAMANLSKQG